MTDPTDTTRTLEAAARAAGMFVTGDGRVSESDLAALLGYSVSRLKQMRSEGGGPPCFRIGINGCRVSYRLAEVAQWIERNRQ